MAGLHPLHSRYPHPPLHLHHLRLRLSFPPPPPPSPSQLSNNWCAADDNASLHQSSRFKLKGLRRRSNRTLNLSCSKINSDNGGWSQRQSAGTKRRELLLQGVLIVAGCSLPLITTTDSVALAAGEYSGAPQDDDFRVYSDDVNKFKILIPRDWQVGSGEGDGIRSLTAFYPQEASSSNVSIVITGLGADFTRLESFGKVDAFAENLVSGLDRSWQRPPGVAAKLIDSKAANGLYYIEYTLQNPGESRRHLFSVLGIANNGWYNRLYTLTGQFVEEEAEKYRSTIQKAVASFRLI